MKDLRTIITKLKPIEVKGNLDKKVSEICFDSRKIEKGALFVAVRGTKTDGHEFISQVVSAGATAVICESLPEKLTEDVTYITVESGAEALGKAASEFYDNPSGKLDLVGITGTNGKTTVATLLHGLFRNLGYNTGLFSTVKNLINDRSLPATHTTPDPVQLNKLLQEMVNEKCTHCFMEVSSHALAQHRTAGLKFSGGVFTNISHDHLDYHGTFDEYIRVKKSFFDKLNSEAFSLVNNDDKRGLVMLQNTKSKKNTFALQVPATYKGKIISDTFSGLELEITGRAVWFRQSGKFNAYNLLAVYAVADLLGEDTEEILLQLSNLPSVSGRFEQVASESGIIGVVDYAHTPDALKNVLETVNSIRTKNEKVITIIGCGGNRDKEKRPKMAEIACRMSDKVILTSDNPREESAEVIIEEMKKGVPPQSIRKVISITDRGEAIKAACAMVSRGDIILLAGKGHETYQEIAGKRYDFDDRKALKEALSGLKLESGF